MLVLLKNLAGYLFCFLFLVFHLIVPEVYAQFYDDHTVETSQRQNSSPESQDDLSTSDELLSLSHEELREQFVDHSSLELAVGHRGPWQNLQISSLFIRDAHQAFHYGMGQGYWNLELKDQELAYDLRLKNRAMNMAWRWYAHWLDILPLYTELGFSYLWINGQLKPRKNLDQEEEAASLLETSFHGHGPSLFTHIGLHWITENGYSWDLSLVGLGYTKMVQLKTTSTDDHLSRDLLGKSVNSYHSWGLFNIAFGLFL